MLRGLSLIFLLIFSAVSAFALSVPKRPEGYISDYAGIISPDARARLEEKLLRFESETTNQVVVVTFPSLEGKELEDFSIRLAEVWKIGQKSKNNGVILLIFKDDRKVRIEAGYGLEGALTDATSRKIIEDEIVPSFRQGKFDEGVEKGVDAIFAAARGEYRAEAETSASASDYLGPAFILGIFLGSFLPILLLGFLFAFGIFLLIAGLLSGPAALIPLAFFGGILPLVFYFLFGRHRRGYSVLSRRGPYSNDSIFWGGGFGGGGFGGGGLGGGGGSFGGGGASGRW